MNRDVKKILKECYDVMIQTIKGYEDRAFQSNKLYEIKQYRSKLPEDMYNKIDSFANKNIRPMVYDVDY